ncbi:MAG: VRR-NUC domain-containing protein [Clostridia bacterium]|nr:VRR-NUC domain-containing protein [Clostridia bacterium]
MSESKIPLERVIVGQIVERLKAEGYSFVCKTHGSAYQISGLPDLLVIGRSGRFVGLEVKRPEIGRLTPIQAATLDRITEAGGYAAVVTSVEEAMDAMARAEAGTPSEVIGIK